MLANDDDVSLVTGELEQAVSQLDPSDDPSDSTVAAA